MAFVKPIQLNMQFWILLMLYRPISTDVYFHVESLLTWKKLLIPVDHSILLSKLNFYGFRGIINNRFSSYQFTKLTTNNTNWSTCVRYGWDYLWCTTGLYSWPFVVFIIYKWHSKLLRQTQFLFVCWRYQYTLCRQKS